MARGALPSEDPVRPSTWPAASAAPRVQMREGGPWPQLPAGVQKLPWGAGRAGRLWVSSKDSAERGPLDCEEGPEADGAMGHLLAGPTVPACRGLGVPVGSWAVGRTASPKEDAVSAGSARNLRKPPVKGALATDGGGAHRKQP